MISSPVHMFSKILLKLIDQAIIPAVLVVVSRVVSLVLISNYLDIDFFITRNGIIFENTKDYVTVNSYSMLLITVLIALGMLMVIINSTLFHHEHIKPKTSAKLFSLKMHSLIKNSFEIYTQATIWISYLWLLTIANALMYYYQMVDLWVFYINIIATVSLTVLLTIDLEKKIKVSKMDEFLFDKNDKYLEKGNNR
jgi:hypothetical protein